MNRPVVNLNELENYEEFKKEGFQSHDAPIASIIGAKKLGYVMTVVEPGKKAAPFHNHHINEEMFLIFSGTGLLRFGEEEYELKPMDIIACPPGGREVAHQIINTGNEDLRYLSLSTMEPVEVCEYPDSDKYAASVGTRNDSSFRHVGVKSNQVDFWQGEK
ncbi:MAG: cupin [Halobacteriovoraceae bacterium]|nr:cupin [Halobacteriovoraceae bacterium]|tara:strand:- start:289877 stop:290359 length:483 start_codon:yes stop_codon:yes gene_type:complete